MVASVLIPVRRMHGVRCNQGSRASLRVQNSGVCQKKICCNGMCEVGKIGNLECTCIEGSKPFISPPGSPSYYCKSRRRVLVDFL